MPRFEVFVYICSAQFRVFLSLHLAFGLLPCLFRYCTLFYLDSCSNESVSLGLYRSLQLVTVPSWAFVRLCPLMSLSRSRFHRMYCSTVPVLKERTFNSYYRESLSLSVQRSLKVVTAPSSVFLDQIALLS